MLRHLRRRAAGGGDAPDVEDLVPFGCEIDLPVCAPHRIGVVNPGAELLRVQVGQPRDLLRADVLDPDIVRAIAAIALAPVGAPFAGERDQRAILLEHARVGVVHVQGARQPAFDGHHVERAAPRAAAALRGEHDTLSIGGPILDRVAGRIECELAGFSSGRRHDEHVVVTKPIAAEGDKFPVR
jgi:hypothetical protein